MRLDYSCLLNNEPTVVIFNSGIKRDSLDDKKIIFKDYLTILLNE